MRGRDRRIVCACGKTYHVNADTWIVRCHLCNREIPLEQPTAKNRPELTESPKRVVNSSIPTAARTLIGSKMPHVPNAEPSLAEPGRRRIKAVFLFTTENLHIDDNPAWTPKDPKYIDFIREGMETVKEYVRANSRYDMDDVALHPKPLNVRSEATSQELRAAFRCASQ